MSDGLSAWSTRPLRGSSSPVVELVDHNGRRLLLTTRNEGELLAAEHNRDVEWARTALADVRANGSGDRATLGDVEALLVRVLVAALRELARGMLPRRLRGRSTPVRNPVHER